MLLGLWQTSLLRSASCTNADLTLVYEGWADTSSLSQQSIPEECAATGKTNSWEKIQRLYSTHYRTPYSNQSTFLANKRKWHNHEILSERTNKPRLQNVDSTFLSHYLYLVLYIDTRITTFWPFILAHILTHAQSDVSRCPHKIILQSSYSFMHFNGLKMTATSPKYVAVSSLADTQQTAALLVSANYLVRDHVLSFDLKHWA